MRERKAQRRTAVIDQSFWIDPDEYLDARLRERVGI